jgi:glycerophosphoryl diester phosphodiesterase
VPIFGTIDRSGNRPAFAPENIFNAWISQSIARGFVVGGGARYVSDQFIAEDNEFAIDGVLTFDAMATADGLLEIATYADGVGPEKTHFLIPRNNAGDLALEDASDFVELAHAANLEVHPYTFRAENQFLPVALRTSPDATELGSAAQELAAFLALGIDGFFTDHTDIGVAERDRHLLRD